MSCISLNSPKVMKSPQSCCSFSCFQRNRGQICLICVKRQSVESTSAHRSARHGRQRADISVSEWDASGSLPAALFLWLNPVLALWQAPLAASSTECCWMKRTPRRRSRSLWRLWKVCTLCFVNRKKKSNVATSFDFCFFYYCATLILFYESKQEWNMRTSGSPVNVHMEQA